MPKSVLNRAPRTKAEFLSRLLAFGFTWNTMTPEGAPVLKQTAPNRLEVGLADGTKFEVVVRRPKSAEQIAALKAQHAAKTAPKRKRNPVVQVGANDHTNH